MGWKDTVIAYPGEVTRVVAKFDREGRHVRHCHILSHEDHEMMRPYYVGTMPGVVAKTGSGLALESPAHVWLDQNTPNPFNPMTTIAFELPVAQHVDLVIYDVAGHKIRDLLSGGYEGGRQSVIWNGKDNHGDIVPSGVYYYRLQTAESTYTRKMIVVR